MRKSITILFAITALAALAACGSGRGPASRQLNIFFQKAVDLATAAPGATLVYTVTASNLQTADLTDVTITDTLPGTVAIVSALETTATGAPVPTVAGQTVTWAIGAMASGVTHTLEITVTINAGTAAGVIIVNRAEVTGTGIGRDRVLASAPAETTVI